MDTTSTTPDPVSTIDSTIQVLRICTEQSLYDADDLIACLLVSRSKVEKLAIVLHLAEKFEHLVRTAPLDGCTAVVGRDLVRAIAAAKGIPSVLFHYQQMAREAQSVAA